MYIMYDAYKDEYYPLKTMEDVEREADKRVKYYAAVASPEELDLQLFHVDSKQRLVVTTLIKKEWVNDE